MNYAIKGNLLLIIFFYIPVFSFTANAQEHEAQKKIEQHYSLNKNQRVSVTNRFGTIAIYNWSQNQVKVEVTITARAADRVAAQSILDAATIESKEGDLITFKTQIAEGTVIGKKGISVDYVVYLPEGNKLDVNNTLGNTVIPSRSGITNITQVLGDLTTGDLMNGNIDSKLGKVVTGILKDVHIKIGHAEVNIKGVSGTINGDFLLCRQLKLRLTDQLKTLDLKLSYSKNAVFMLPASFNGNFNIEIKYGKLDNQTTANIPQTTSEESFGFSFKRAYAGRMGSGKVPVRIYSDFGNVILE
ncbi:hypothetical protein [Niabella beijingensis]|uniref:hypothetical protein n=1 Tax=Niabella beijingensis TaxID=2872700 RepID=UPI001CBBD774|nr:hypothetical protein [Niabella beijingensis]MBZ4189752.1 hypothetical protein [Niabella beijingensis]